MATRPKVNLERANLAPLCQKWHIKEISVFGSVARGTETDESDVDLMVTFDPEAELSLWDLVAAKYDFEQLLGRPVDLVEAGTIRNPYRKASIERDLRLVYAA